MILLFNLKKKCMKKIFTIVSAISFSTLTFAQTVASGITVSPIGTNGDVPITVTVNLNEVCTPENRDMDFAWNTISFHSGVITAVGPWQNVVEWNDANSAVFTKTAEGVYSATITPRDYYSVPAGTNVLGFSFVFNGYPNTAGDWDAEAKSYDDVGNCTDFLYYFADEIASLSKKNLQEVSVYPNPTSSHVNFGVSEAEFQINIYSITGKIVKSSKESVVDVSDLTDGTYFYSVETSTSVSNGKIVKK
jgi:hypothetical protein